MSIKYMEKGDYRRGQNRLKLGLAITALSFAAMLGAQSISYLELEAELEKTKESLQFEAALYDESLNTIEVQDALLNQYKPLITLATEILTGCEAAILDSSYCMVWNIEGRGLVAEGNL
jgi:hypothetical protein